MAAKFIKPSRTLFLTIAFNAPYFVVSPSFFYTRQIHTSLLVKKFWCTKGNHYGRS